MIPSLSEATIEALSSIFQILGSSRIPGTSLISPLYKEIYIDENDQTISIRLNWMRGGLPQTIRIKISSDGSIKYSITSEASKVDTPLIPLGINNFWGSPSKRASTLRLAVQVSRYFHEWLGATLDGDMIECDASGQPISPVNHLTGQPDGQVTFIVNRRATLENFLRFLRGDAPPTEMQWASDPAFDGLGMAALLAEYAALP
jgi:hypothetical protein